MKNGRNRSSRIICVVLSTVLFATLMAGCAKSSETDAQLDPLEFDNSLPVTSDISYICIPGEHAEIAQEMKISVENSEIKGTIAEKDIVLGEPKKTSCSAILLKA